jgi:hypothetical protein
MLPDLPCAKGEDSWWGLARLWFSSSPIMPIVGVRRGPQANEAFRRKNRLPGSPVQPSPQKVSQAMLIDLVLLAIVVILGVLVLPS